jgi:hypothetical protein
VVPYRHRAGTLGPSPDGDAALVCEHLQLVKASFEHWWSGSSGRTPTSQT